MSEEQKKDIRLSIKISKTERDALHKKARELGYWSTSKYVRDILSGIKIIPKTDMKTIIQLKKIGNNINQIAKICNENKSISSVLSVYSELMKELNFINKIISDIKYYDS